MGLDKLSAKEPHFSMAPYVVAAARSTVRDAGVSTSLTRSGFHDRGLYDNAEWEHNVVFWHGSNCPGTFYGENVRPRGFGVVIVECHSPHAIR